MAVFYFPKAAGQCLVLCLSADTKPTTPDGFVLVEIDTGKFFNRESGVWVEKLNSAYGQGAGAAWGGVTGTLSAQTDLQAALDAKAAGSHTHAWTDVTGEPTTLAGYGITDGATDTELSAAIAAHEAAGNPHPGYLTPAEGDAAYDAIGAAAAAQAASQPLSSNLTEYAAVNPTAAGLALLDDADAAAQRTTMGAAATSHTHAIADLTDDGALAALNTVGTSQIDNDAVTFAKIQNITDVRLLGRSAGSAGDCQEITVGSGLSLAAGALTASGGGSDPWTYVALGSNFVSSATANTNVTGLNFTPAANLRYHVEGSFLLRTATATSGARPGIAWPAGYSDGAAYMQAPNSLTAIAMQMGTPAAGTANAASTGLPVIDRSYAAQMQAILIMGASPSGNFQITLAAETSGVNATMAAGSFIRYRTY